MGAGVRRGRSGGRGGGRRLRRGPDAVGRSGSAGNLGRRLHLHPAGAAGRLRGPRVPDGRGSGVPGGAAGVDLRHRRRSGRRQHDRAARARNAGGRARSLQRRLHRPRNRGHRHGPHVARRRSAQRPDSVPARCTRTLAGRAAARDGRHGGRPGAAHERPLHGRAVAAGLRSGRDGGRPQAHRPDAGSRRRLLRARPPRRRLPRRPARRPGASAGARPTVARACRGPLGRPDARRRDAELHGPDALPGRNRRT